MSTTITWTLGELIAKGRKEAGLDQKQLAERAGIARNSLSNYETGRSVPPFDVAVRIALICGVDLDWFATAVNDETPANGEGFGNARLEGFEPPTFWSVARSLELVVLWQSLDSNEVAR